MKATREQMALLVMEILYIWTIIPGCSDVDLRQMLDGGMDQFDFSCCSQLYSLMATLTSCIFLLLPFVFNVCKTCCCQIFCCPVLILWFCWRVCISQSIFCMTVFHTKTRQHPVQLHCIPVCNTPFYFVIFSITLGRQSSILSGILQDV